MHQNIQLIRIEVCRLKICEHIDGPSPKICGLFLLLHFSSERKCLVSDSGIIVETQSHQFSHKVGAWMSAARFEPSSLSTSTQLLITSTTSIMRILIMVVDVVCVCFNVEFEDSPTLTPSWRPTFDPSVRPDRAILKATTATLFDDDNWFEAWDNFLQPPIIREQLISNCNPLFGYLAMFAETLCCQNMFVRPKNPNQYGLNLTQTSP